MVTEEIALEGHEQPAQARPPAFRQGVFFTGIGSLVTLVSLFLETMVAVRVLSAEEYGVYVLLIAVVTFFLTVVDFGCKTAVTQFVASSDEPRQILLAHSTLVFRFVVLVFVSLLIYLTRDMLRLLDSSGGLSNFGPFIPLMLVVASFDELLLAVLQGFQRFRPVAVAQVIRSVVRVTLSVIFLLVLKVGVVALLLSWVISFALSALYQYVVLPIPKHIIWQRSLLGNLLRFGVPIQVDRVLWYLSSKVDVLLLGMFVGPVGVAYYNIAATIPSALVRVAQSFVAVFFPSMAALLAGGKNRSASAMLNHSLRLCSLLGTAAALCAVVFAKEITVLLFSEKYAASSNAFALLMIAFHLMVLLTLTGYSLTAAGFPKRSLGQNSVNMALTVVFDLALIPPLGFLGPAIAQVVSSYGASPVSVWLLRRSNIRPTVAPCLKQMALLWTCAGLCWWIHPDAIIYKLGIIALFIVLNAAWATISVADLTLILPTAVTRRLTFLEE